MSGTNQIDPPRVGGARAERGELELLRHALDASGDVSYAWDLDTDTMSWSFNAHRVFGLDSSTDIASRSAFIARVNGADVANLARIQDGPDWDGGPYQVEYRLRRGDGEFCWVQDRGVVSHADGGRAARAGGAIRVITAHKQNQARREWLANYDEITGHYNRLRLRELLDHAFAYAERYDAPGAYLSVAIDDLPMISDAYGCEVADRAMIEVGQALDQCLRASDVVGRVAPDQFGVIVSGCLERDVPVTAEKILDAVFHAAVPTTAGSIQLTASIGGVSFPSTVRAAHDAVTKADVALAHARRDGQNGYVAYNLTEEQRSGRRRDLAVAREVQDALQGDSLRLAFQPVVRGDTHDVAFYECLIRIPSGDGYLPTGPALGVAESMGLIRLIDRRVLEMAVMELSANPDATLAINISGLTTSDPTWLRTLVALVGNRPEIAERLIVEITETAALEDMEETVNFVSAVRAKGCRVALDDFGAGYTSFRHLKTLAVDIVKIDGSFVVNLATRPEDFLFIKTLLELASGFGLTTVAECVEDAEVAGMLSKEGVDYLQGYYFARPSLTRPWRAAPAPRRATTGSAVVVSPDFRGTG